VRRAYPHGLFAGKQIVLGIPGRAARRRVRVEDSVHVKQQ
jgi:hypothetical protein